LDRALLSAGTEAYVAPFWDVTAEEAQTAIDDIIVNYINQPNQTLGETLQEYLESQPLSYITASLALFGDLQ